MQDGIISAKHRRRDNNFKLPNFFLKTPAGPCTQKKKSSTSSKLNAQV